MNLSSPCPAQATLELVDITAAPIVQVTEPRAPEEGILKEETNASTREKDAPKIFVCQSPIRTIIPIKECQYREAKQSKQKTEDSIAMSDHSDMTHRHLRLKLQSLGRRLDELEETTKKLQKSEDELLDLQDKIIQAEGSNSSLLSEVEVLRKKLLKIQGKDEEVRKAEDLCRTVREKLEEEENLTKELKAETEHLQSRMVELEKLEEALGKSKSDCSQLGLSLNEEKNLTKKLSSELEVLQARLKDLEGSEIKLEKAEQAFATELDKLKGFTQTFVNERKRLLEKQREDEKLILNLKEKLEHHKNSLGLSADPGHTDFIRSRIEDELSSTGFLTSKLAGRKKSLDYLKRTDDISLHKSVKNISMEGSQEEDNKVKELTQEVERLKNRLKHLEIVEEDLKSSESKNGELQEKFQIESSRTRELSELVEQLRTQLCEKGKSGRNGTANADKHGNGSTDIYPNCPTKVLENGKAETEEIVAKSVFRQEKPKHRSTTAFSEPSSPKYKNSREHSPQHKRETKLRSRELSHSEDNSPKSARRAISPAPKSRRTPRTQAIAVSSDNGIRDAGRGTEEKTRGTNLYSANTSSSDVKKASVLSRYPPAANDQKPLRMTHRQADGEIKKSRLEKFSRKYMGSDSESNNSDVVLEGATEVGSTAGSERDTASASDQESTDQAPESISSSATSTLSKANGSYTAYRSNMASLLPNDQGSEGHSSASETESTGSRPSEPEPAPETASTVISSRTNRFPRYSNVQEFHTEGSSTRFSFDEEPHSRTLSADGSHQGATYSPSGLEIQRVCSPRESLRSKAVIKPAIVEIDKKEMMISEALSSNGKPRISTKPIVTSSITIYPNDPNSSRTSSRSSSVSSETPPVKERHTSTSNILIGPSSEHHGSISVPYEISISKSDITSWPSQDQHCGADNINDSSSSRSKLQNSSRTDTSAGHPCSQRSSLSLQTAYNASAMDCNDTESGFESSSSSSTTTVTSWRRQRQSPHSRDESVTDTKSLTVRSTWKNKAAAHVEESGKGRGGKLALTDAGSEDEAEATWRAYRATTTDNEESVNSGTGPGGNTEAQRGAKPSPAETYMRKINSAVTRDGEESGFRRAKRSESPSVEAGGTGKVIPHAPVTSQSWARSYTQPQATDVAQPSANLTRSPAAWRRPIPTSDSHHLGSSYERASKTPGASSRGDAWSSRGQASGSRAEGRSGAGSRPWSHRQSEHH